MDILKDKIQFYSIYINNIRSIVFNDIDKTIEEIITMTCEIYIKLQQIYISYMSLSYEDKVSNIYSNILLCELLYKFCIMIYTNKKIIDDIIGFNNLPSRNTRRTAKKSGMKETKFFNYINNNKNPEYESKINTYDTYVKYLIALFNNDIYAIELTNNTVIMSLDTIMRIKPTAAEIHRFNFETYDIETFKRIILDSSNISIFIKLLINLINTKIYIKSGMSYITLPQYEGICWFISMLCGITYSDMSKKLLIKKRLKKIPASSNTFKKFAYDIIDNITKDFKKYNTTSIYSDCELLLNLKFTPLNVFRDILIAEVRNKDESYYMNILYKLCSQIADNEIKDQQTKSSIIFKDIYNIRENMIDNICIDILINEIFKQDFKFNEVLNLIPYIDSYTNDQKKRIIALHIYHNILLKKLAKSSIFNFDLGIGISFNQNHILSYLYNLLEISNNYYYCYKESKDKELQIRKKLDSIILPNPDVIIIENCKYEEVQFLNLDSSITEQISIQNEIIYNGITYKLDYILHPSNDNYTCEGCGHCISAIHYDNKEYIYDSKFHNYMINCHSFAGIDNTISIPCPLLEEKWSEKINTDTCYRVEKCGIINNKKSGINKREIDKFKSMCYTYDENIIYVYINKML